MIKYLHWKLYDWLLVLPVTLWVMVVTTIMSPMIVTEYMIMMVPRTIRENRFYERHDFGEIEDRSNMDDMDRQAVEEMEERHVMGNFLYRSKMVRIWMTLVTFRKGRTLR